MSNPVKTEDIEDVLSSIRRLVSEEPRPRAPQPPESVAQPEKLVLTPAFRVAEGRAGDPVDTERENAEAATADAQAEDATEGPAPDLCSGTTLSVEEGPRAEADVESWDKISLEERVAELEAAVAESGEEWEPDGSEAEPQEIPLKGLGAGDEVDATAEAEGAAMGEDGGEAVLDEEALREMVAEIVRQELQGAMGQRITRNVRKLVRQEINRALASRDLE